MAHVEFWDSQTLVCKGQFMQKWQEHAFICKESFHFIPEGNSTAEILIAQDVAEMRWKFAGTFCR